MVQCILEQLWEMSQTSFPDIFQVSLFPSWSPGLGTIAAHFGQCQCPGPELFYPAIRTVREGNESETDPWKPEA